MRFDALEDLVKARQAKGPSKWKKFEALSSELEGKSAHDITFTTSYPGQEGTKKYLGSSTGNLMFLLGYVNPGFHVSDYHWKMVDPNMSDEEIKAKGHPANPRYWKEAGLEIEFEGDLTAGKPHPSARGNKVARAKSAAKNGGLKAQAGYGTYLGDPASGKVYSLVNGHVYDWDLVKDSFMAAINPDFKAAMSATDDDSTDKPVKKSVLESLRKPIGPFDDEVYSLVKSVFPVPGSVVPMPTGFALIGKDSVEFYNSKGIKASVEVFGRVYDSFDLTKGGDINPSIIMNFATEFLGMDIDYLGQFVHRENS